MTLNIAALKQELAADMKEVKREVGDQGHRVDAPERSGDAHEEELDSYRCELLELQDQNVDPRYQLEDLENQSRRSNIRI
ncbi:hypothetical protein NDU88_003710 [Pleurodeles waltl]|uniref:Tropomyosin n=1 Tax=Pleurodeles waltl TaxID=8319 RepID=A0AAV7W2Y4_PLEWA|nr:hypothetical protein NDU88_003710 [Pleurodeles waltl]